MTYMTHLTNMTFLSSTFAIPIKRLYEACYKNDPCGC